MDTTCYYEVTDLRTGTTRRYATRAAATRAAERIDRAYGAIRSTVRMVRA